MPDTGQNSRQITPPRRFTPMLPQPIIPWTIGRLLFAGLEWLLAPTPVSLEPVRIRTVIHRTDGAE